jgi:hypothetical protein
MGEVEFNHFQSLVLDLHIYSNNIYYLGMVRSDLYQSQCIHGKNTNVKCRKKSRYHNHSRKKAVYI